MKIYFGRIFSLTAVILLSAFASAAQNVEDGKNEVSVWGGYSSDSTTIIRGTGRTEDARFGIFAVRYSRRFNNNNAVNLKYTADFIPAAILNYKNEDPVLSPPVDERRTSYGFGVAPLGLQMNFRPRKKLQPFIGASSGLLYFSRRIPNESGTRFTYTADVGAGIEYRLRNNRAITFGYKYFHISNGGGGVTNPGIDNNLLYIGYTFFSK